MKAPPERVYRAFLDPKAKVKWLPPHGFTGEVHHLDARVGGTYRMSFTNFATGHAHQALSEICSVASPRGPRRGQAAEAKGPGDGFWTR